MRLSFSYIRFALLLISLGFFATTTSAQTSCLLYPSNAPPAAGYGASWDVLSSGKELLVKSDCPTTPGTNLTITIGRGVASQYIWGTSYVYTGSGWQAYTLSGTSAGSGWLSGTGTKTITVPYIPFAEHPLFFVGYVCTPSGSSFKCGCTNASCTTRHWQLQANTGTGGGTVGGTVGGSTGSESVNCSGGSSGSNNRTITQEGAVIKGQTFNGTVSIQADNVTFACNRITGGNPGIIIGGKNVKVLNNDIGSSSGGIYLDDRYATNAEIAYNHLHDAADKSVGIYVGTGRGTHEVQMNTNVHHNLITNWESHNCIEMKSSKNTIAFNTLIGGDESCTINNRHGWDNSFIANWVEKGGINASDYRTRVIGNVLRSSSGYGSGLRVKAGNVHPENYTDVPGQYVSSKDALLAGNEADVFILGWKANGDENLPARDITIEAHKGAQPVYGLVQGVTIRANTSLTIPQAAKLSPSQVGTN